MELNLDGKIAVVTGASHGIGKEIAIELAKEGCTLAICSRNKRYSLPAVKDDIIAANYGNIGCYAEVADMADRGQRLRFIANVIDQYKRIDILVHNVGGGGTWGNSDHFHLTQYKTYQEVMDINYLSTVELTQLALPFMLENKFGRIIAIASIFGKEGGGMPWYQSAKSAQISYMKSMSALPEYAEANITFNTLCPGFIDMPDKPIDEKYLVDVPSSKFGIPENIATMVALLSSPKSWYTNGACITIDGGYTKSF